MSAASAASALFGTAALAGFVAGIFLGLAVHGPPIDTGRNEACASVCDDYGWWSDSEERCICAKEPDESETGG